MRELVYYVAVTLDGFITGPDGGDPSGSEFFPVTDDLLRFIVENHPETLPGPARAALGVDGAGRAFDTVVEGRGSYEIGLAAGTTNAYPHLRHLVFSTSMTVSPDPGVELVADGALDRIRELKAEAGQDIWLVGGGTLAASLLPEIDRLVLKVNPSIVGDGIRLFAGTVTPVTFAPAGEVVLKGGVRVVTYTRTDSL